MGLTGEELFSDDMVFGQRCGIKGLLDIAGLFSRMRSEGFSFNSWGSGGRALFATRCFYVRNRSQPSATVRNRPQPFAVER